MKWKLAVFDWDGTLVDSVALAYEATACLFAKFDLAPPPYEAYLAANLSSPGAILAFYHAHDIPVSASETEMRKTWERHSIEHYVELQMREGALDLLRLCREMGMNTAIVSSNAQSVISTGLDQFSLSGLIDHVQADACGKVEELRRVLQAFDVSPAEAFYVDDTFEGVNAAHSVGMTAIGIEGGFGKLDRLRQAGATWCVQSHNEISHVLSQNQVPTF